MTTDTAHRAIAVDNEGFDAVVAAGGLTLVDFWAPWCGPCHAIAPILERIASEEGEALTVAKLNVDEHPDRAVALGIRALPTLKLFRGGEVVETLVGVQTRATLTAAIDRARV